MFCGSARQHSYLVPKSRFIACIKKILKIFYAKIRYKIVVNFPDSDTNEKKTFGVCGLVVNKYTGLQFTRAHV